MSNCNLNKIIADKVGIQKFTKYDEVDINIAKDIDACVKVNAKNATVTVGNNAVYDKRAIPRDAFNTCEGFGCKNTGTLYATSVGNGVTYQFKALADAREFAAGMMVFYLDLDKTAINADVTVTVSDITDKENADVYTLDVDAEIKNEYFTAMVDLAKPSSTVGNGWTPTSNGILVKVNVSGAKDVTHGISSIAFFEDVSDLESNIAIKMSCLSSVDGEDTVDPLDTTCTRDGYDDTSVSVERTIEGTLLTANGLMLDPLIDKGTKTEGFRMRTIEVTVEANDEEDASFGLVKIADHYTEECGFVYASLSDSCNVTDSVLTRINAPDLVDIDDSQFQVLNAVVGNVSVTSLNEGSVIAFNKSLIGKTVKISYPSKVDIEHYVASAKNLDGKRASVTYTTKMTDGTVRVYHYKRAFITSFPHGIPDDGSMSISFQFKEDTNGNLYELSVVNNEASYL